MNFSRNGNKKRCISVVCVFYYVACIKRSYNHSLVKNKVIFFFCLIMIIIFSIHKIKYILSFVCLFFFFLIRNEIRIRYGLKCMRRMSKPPQL